MRIGRSMNWQPMKKFNPFGSSRKMMNKQSVQALRSSISAAGSTIFSATMSQGEGMSILAAQAMKAREIASVQAEIQKTRAQTGQSLNLLA